MIETMIPCTVGILTFNNGATLARALDSVEGFAEVIVCDGGSTDETLSIARARGVRLLFQDKACQDSTGRLVDFAGAMNQMVESASQPWFYKLDSDELLSDGLREELRPALESGDQADAFLVSFRYVVAGVQIEQATTYPASEPRLFRIGSGLRYERPVHERLPVVDARTATLSAPHLKPLPSARETLRKWAHYLAVEAHSAKGCGFDTWRDQSLRKHWKSAKYLTWKYSKILRSRRGPRLPARYELLRIANDLAAIVVTGVAAVFGRSGTSADGHGRSRRAVWRSS